MIVAKALASKDGRSRSTLQINVFNVSPSSTKSIKSRKSSSSSSKASI